MWSYRIYLSPIRISPLLKHFVSAYLYGKVFRAISNDDLKFIFGFLWKYLSRSTPAYKILEFKISFIKNNEYSTIDKDKIDSVNITIKQINMHNKGELWYLINWYVHIKHKNKWYVKLLSVASGTNQKAIKRQRQVPISPNI